LYLNSLSASLKHLNPDLENWLCNQTQSNNNKNYLPREKFSVADSSQNDLKNWKVHWFELSKDAGLSLS